MATRVAIVTGASKGIGRAIALRLADDGLDIAVNDLERQREQLEAVVKEIESRGQRAIAFYADVSTDDGVRGLVDTTVEKLGSVDVMIANAGIAIFSPIVDMSVEDWDRVVNVNLRGPFLQYKYAAQQMIKQGRGGRILGYKDLASYVASKFGVRGITQTAAAEWGKYGITVNAYAPGFIKTDLAVTEADAGRGPGVAVKLAFGYGADAPIGEVDDVASLVSYIVKPEAHFITGQMLTLDGGVLLA
ncbi:hypothetical protein PLICRDRAFT_177894 [Plicaturopsis crispa FD-325 SS-3]|nr:hypothetical protein PLICRDRAFT_177894 [Plicaturopsis crispa FD-325 SS-3]